MVRRTHAIIIGGAQAGVETRFVTRMRDGGGIHRYYFLALSLRTRDVLFVYRVFLM